MKKLLLVLISLFFIFNLCFCSKEDNLNSMVKLNTIDIDALSNKSIIDIVSDNSLEEGIYQINTTSKIYVYFFGKNNEFYDINCTLNNKTLNISCLSRKSNSSSKQLFTIYQKNITSSNNKYIYFDKINLSLDNKNINFKDVFNIS